MASGNQNTTDRERAPEDRLSRSALGPILDPETLDPSLELSLPVLPRETVSGLTVDGRLKSGKLAGLSMNKAILVLSWPIMVESLLNSTVGLTDTILSAEISEAATDAIAAASYILWFVGLIAMAIGVGATALVSRAVGGGRWAVAHAATAQTMILAVICGCLVAGLVALAAEPASHAMNLTGPGVEAFRTYMWIVALGVPAMTIVSAGIACARGAGDSVRPLMSMAVVNIVNIVASFLLSGVDFTHTAFTSAGPVTRTVLTNPGWAHMGIGGIAWGTVLGEWVGAVVIIVMLVRGSTGVRLKRHRLRPHWHTLRRLIRVGIPNFLETFGMWVGNFMVILIVGWLSIQAAGGASSTGGAEHGGGLMGAHIVCIRIEAFSFLPGFAVGVAAATLVGQYLGAGSQALAYRAVFRCAILTSAFMGLFGIAFILWPGPIVGLISSQPTHLAVCPVVMAIAGWVQVPFGIGLVLRSALRGSGDVKVVMWLTWISTYLIRLPLAWALSGVDVPIPAFFGGGTIDNPFTTEPSLPMLWLGLCIDLVLRAVLFGARFVHGGWLKARV